VRVEEPEAIAAAHNELEETQLRHVPALDRGEASYHFGNRGLTDFPSFPDEANAKRPAVAQAGLGHLQVALLEDPERQGAAGKKHGAERENEMFFGHVQIESSRCRTSTRPCRARKYSASVSAR
jgi:hypothetical protein